MLIMAEILPILTSNLGDKLSDVGLFRIFMFI